MFQYQVTGSSILLLLPLVSSAAFSCNNIVPNPGYDLFSKNEDRRGHNEGFYRSEFINTTNTFRTTLIWTHTPGKPQCTGDLDNCPNTSLTTTLNSLYNWFVVGDSAITLTPCSYSALGDGSSTASARTTRCGDNQCTVDDVCTPFYYCLLQEALPPINGITPRGPTFYACLSEKFNITSNQVESSTWRCWISLSSDLDPDPNGHVIGRLSPCDSEIFDLTESNWATRKVDENLQIAVHGGVDSQGLYWEGRRKSEKLAETVGRQFWGLRGVKCTLDSPCQEPLDCKTIGSFTAVALGKRGKIMQQPWVFLASSALMNINQQLLNQYNELKDAIESLALDTFSIDEFFPKKGQDFGLQNGLAGLSVIFSILGGFIPVAGPAISAAGTIASGVGSFLSNSVSASTDPLEAQRNFASKVLVFYRAFLSAIDEAVTKLFEGESIPDNNPGSFNLTDMMKNGAWVNPNSVTKVSNLNKKIKIEILSRSIDALWKTYPSNKMWVLFTDLGDGIDTTKCQADTSGPFDSKYCADGGVYYTYNFAEMRSEAGGVSWPWGADKLQPNANISLKWVTEASAKSYRVMKSANLDPFDFSQIAGTQYFLKEAFNRHDGDIDLSQYAGRYPGSWTLPVCDASTWGKGWNWDYATPGNDVEKSPTTHPPCLCGPKALETYDWASAAGLDGFETFWHRCSDALRDSNFVWPEGVTFVNYPANEGNKDFTVWKP